MAWTEEDGFRLNNALKKEKALTARWYQRISGQVLWEAGEREKIDRQSDQIASEINALMKRKAAEEFGSLGWESEQMEA